MTANSLNSIEERIQKPGYLLMVVVVLLLLIIGLVDLIDHFSQETPILGRYTPGYFAILVAYTLLTIAWASLLLRPNDDRWLVAILEFLQNRPILAIPILLAIGAAITLMLVPAQKVHSLLLEKPALQVTILFILLLSGGLLLFYDWSNARLWRKFAAGFLAFLVVVELLIQALSFLGLAPSLTTTKDSFAPYGRIYQTEEGFGNGIANKFGRYTPEFELLPDSQRIAVIGGPNVQALQVKAEQNLGVLLEQEIAQNTEGDSTTEVLTLGYPDYGPGMYLSNWMLGVADREFDLNETIIFFDLGRDFQIVDGPGQGLPYFLYAGQGQAELQLDDFFQDIHNAEHDVYQGYEGFQLVRVLGSHYLTPRILNQILLDQEVVAEEADAGQAYDINLANGFVFNEETNEEATLIATSLINMANEQLNRYGTVTKLVTIPVFTTEFYAQDGWNTRFGDSDLLLPEHELRTAAQKYGIPFLGLGTYMASRGLSPADVQALYFNDGLGHLTSEGHAFTAEAVYSCFYAQTLTPEEGCHQP
jgi:hypothetical protein